MSKPGVIDNGWEDPARLTPGFSCDINYTKLSLFLLTGPTLIFLPRGVHFFTLGSSRYPPPLLTTHVIASIPADLSDSAKFHLRVMFYEFAGVPPDVRE